MKVKKLNRPGKERKALIRLLAIQMKKSLVNWNKEGIDDQKIVEDLREFSNGAIDLQVEDLRLNEQRYYNNQRRQSNQRKPMNFQKRKQY